MLQRLQATQRDGARERFQLGYWRVPEETDITLPSRSSFCRLATFAGPQTLCGSSQGVPLDLRTKSGQALRRRGTPQLQNHVAAMQSLSLIHISEPTRRTPISY